MKDVDATTTEKKVSAEADKSVEKKDVKTDVKPTKKGSETLKKVRNFAVGFMSGVVVGGTAAIVVLKAIGSKK